MSSRAMAAFTCPQQLEGDQLSWVWAAHITVLNMLVVEVQGRPQWTFASHAEDCINGPHVPFTSHHARSSSDQIYPDAAQPTIAYHAACLDHLTSAIEFTEPRSTCSRRICCSAAVAHILPLQPPLPAHSPCPMASHRYSLKVRLFRPQSASLLQRFTSWLAGMAPEFSDPRFPSYGEGREGEGPASGVLQRGCCQLQCLPMSGCSM
jgi:hypothetical protein